MIKMANFATLTDKQIMKKQLLLYLFCIATSIIAISLFGNRVKTESSENVVEALANGEDDPFVLRTVPCPAYNRGNQCKTSNDRFYPECYKLSYCN